jgi:hypothetical protein
MLCVQTVQKGKVSFSPEGRPKFYKSVWREQNKFHIQTHSKSLSFPIQKREQLAKLITSKVRQRVKPGSAKLILLATLSAFLPEAFELWATPTRFLSRAIFIMISAPSQDITKNS